MSRPTTARARPLSPHLTIYRWPVTMAMSILHRATGIALYFGTLLIAWWLLAAATSAEAFDTAQWVFGSWIGMLVLLGYSWALIHHMLGGIRHLIWDTGSGLEKHAASRVARIQVIASVLLTVVVWAIGLTVRGGF